jgi:hypothetical protein
VAKTIHVQHQSNLLHTSVLIAAAAALQSLEAKTIYVQHQGVIEDVAWHQHHGDIFGSVGDDKQLILWDTRKPPRDGEQHNML